MTDIDEFLLAVDDPSAIEEIDSGSRKQVDQEFDQELGPLIDGREVATTSESEVAEVAGDDLFDYVMEEPTVERPSMTAKM